MMGAAAAAAAARQGASMPQVRTMWRPAAPLPLFVQVRAWAPPEGRRMPLAAPAMATRRRRLKVHMPCPSPAGKGRSRTSCRPFKLYLLLLLLPGGHALIAG